MGRPGGGGPAKNKRRLSQRPFAAGRSCRGAGTVEDPVGRNPWPTPQPRMEENPPQGPGPAAQAREAFHAPASGPRDVAALSAVAQRFRDWPEILQRIRGDTKSVAMAFAGSAAYVNGEYMLIDAPELAFELLKRPEQRDRMREAIRQVTGRVYRLGPYRRRAKEDAQEGGADPWPSWNAVRREQGVDLRIEASQQPSGWSPKRGPRP